MTTTDRSEAVAVEDSDWTSGGSPLQSYVSPWVPMSVKHERIHNRQGTVRQSIVRQVVEKMVFYIQKRR